MRHQFLAVRGMVQFQKGLFKRGYGSNIDGIVKNVQSGPRGNAIIEDPGGKRTFVNMDKHAVYTDFGCVLSVKIKKNKEKVEEKNLLLHNFEVLIGETCCELVLFITI